MNRTTFAFAALLLVCAPASGAHARPAVLSGLDVLEKDGFAPLRGKRIGVITNHTGRDAKGRSVVEVLGKAPKVTLAAVFSPEHGFTGAVEAGENASSSSFVLDGRSIPIFSLYRGGLAGMRPRQEDLAGLDALVFDIQDIGVRCYTYLATMGMAMEEAKARGLEFVVLDRPNPINGVTLEGPLTEDTLRSVTSVAYYKVPVRHGLTAGETARMYADELGFKKLTVVPMRGWRRSMWYDQTGLPWIAPSPNMPSLESATLYPGTSLFESSNLSVGRGTPWPFRWVGAPWLDAGRVAAEMDAEKLEGVRFTVAESTPTKDPFTGQLCRGVLMTVTDRDALRPLAVFRKLYEAVGRANPKDASWNAESLKRMTGTSEFQPLAERGDADGVRELFDRAPEVFRKARKPFLLY